MKYTITIFILLLPLLIFAQLPPGFGNDDNVMDVPIDGGLSILIAAGVGIGTKKMKGKQKNCKKQPTNQ